MDYTISTALDNQTRLLPKVAAYIGAKMEEDAIINASIITYLYEYSWTNVPKIGPEFGYLAKPMKAWLNVKEEYLFTTSEAFHNQITSQGKRYLGCSPGNCLLR